MEKESRNVDKAIDKLTRELGTDKVKSDDFFRAAYSSEGMAAFRPGMPNAVALPSSIEEVQSLVKIAGEYRAPLIPVGARVSGFRMLEVPSDGAIVVDLADMNKIIEINEEHLFVNAEAGCSVYQVDNELRKRGYRIACHPVAQPGAFTMGSEIAKNSIGAYGSGIGPVDRWTIGIKIVLGNGEVLETGACRMMGLPHYQRHHLPDPTGLFMASDGGLGIVVEVTQRLLPVPVSIRSVDVEFPVSEEGEMNLIRAANEIRVKNLFFDMYWAPPSNLSFFLRSEHYLNTLSKEEMDRLTKNGPPYGDFPPEIFKNLLLVVVESIVSEEEASARERECINICKKYGGVHKAGGEFAVLMDLPENMWGSKTPYIRGELGQGMNWLYWAHSYPMFEVPAALKKIRATGHKTGLSPTRFYFGSYFTPDAGSVNGFVHYHFDDPEEVEKALKWIDICNQDLLFNWPGSVTPNFAIGRVSRPYVLSKLKPYCSDFLKEIKRMCDPNGIMNPGCGIY